MIDNCQIILYEESYTCLMKLFIFKLETSLKQILGSLLLDIILHESRKHLAWSHLYLIEMDWLLDLKLC